MQTLVENAVRHGAAPRIESTTITLCGTVQRGDLTITVRDDGAGASAERLGATSGSGLKRLRDRLAVLYGGRASLDVRSPGEGGFIASLTIPLTEVE